VNIGPGDEVITTPFTFIATANTMLYQGARPVFADIGLKTYNVDPEQVVEKITERTKAIIAVHLFGHPADMKALSEIAEEHRLILIEDAAQARGAKFMGKKAGSFGHVAIFSLYATKNMTTGEGGMVVTDDDEFARRIRLLRDHGQLYKYYHVELGYNYGMTDIQAAIGRVQLRKLDSLNAIRRRNAEFLTMVISRIKGLIPPYVDPRVEHVFHQYVIRVSEEFPLTRDQLAKELEERGISMAIYYPTPVHHQPLYQKLGYRQDDCLYSIIASRIVLSLPVYPALTQEDLEYTPKTLEGISRGAP